MNLPYFISKRIRKGASHTFSSTVHKIAIASIALGLAIMIVSFLILYGFQDTVKERIFSFSSHLQITKYSLNNSFEEAPMSLDIDIYNTPEQFEVIEHVQEYGHKAGLLKTKEEVMGVVFKGIGRSFDTTAFAGNLVEGHFPHFQDSTYSKDVLVSRNIADKLKLSVGDDMIVHFFQNPPRVRKLVITGIYNTNLSEYFDDKFIIGDIDLIRRLNQWPDSLAGGIEVFVKDFNAIDEAEAILEEASGYQLLVEKVSDKYIQIFEWLFLIKRQVNIFLYLILFVVCINMISIILILIMERAQMIGMLKALGASDAQVRNVFLYSGMRLIVKGLFLGNSIGLGLCALQYYFHLIPLKAKDYYMDFVPVSWNWPMVIGLNLLTFLVVFVILLIPTLFIVRIKPIKAIRFD